MDMRFGTWNVRCIGHDSLRTVAEEIRKMGLREAGWGGMNWIDLAQDRDQWRALVNMVMNLRVL
jgi:hypothetical protein